MAASRRTFVLFLVLCFSQILLISTQVQSRSGLPIVQSAAFGVFARVQQATAALGDTFRSLWANYVALQGVAADNDRLSRRVLELEGQVQQHAAIASRARGLEQLLGLQATLAVPTLAARVIGGEAAPGSLILTIDRGSADGVEMDMAVIGQHGVIGRVVNTPTAHAAQVLLLVGRNGAAAGVIERTGAAGMVKGGASNPALRMEMVDVLRDVQSGDRVVTSGIEGIFPRGFFIGTVERAVKGSGTYSEITIRPAQAFDDLEVVLVLLGRPVREKGES